MKLAACICKSTRLITNSVGSPAGPTTASQRTVAWYRAVHEGASPLDCCLADLACYNQDLVA